MESGLTLRLITQATKESGVFHKVTKSCPPPSVSSKPFKWCPSCVVWCFSYVVWCPRCPWCVCCMMSRLCCWMFKLCCMIFQPYYMLPLLCCVISYVVDFSAVLHDVPAVLRVVSAVLYDVPALLYGVHHSFHIYSLDLWSFGLFSSINAGFYCFSIHSTTVASLFFAQSECHKSFVPCCHWTPNCVDSCHWTSNCSDSCH